MLAYRLLVSLAMTGLLGAAGAAYAETKPAQPIIDKEGRFSLQIPGDWETQTDPILAFSAVKTGEGDDEDASEGIQIAVAKRVEGVDLDQYVKNSTQAYQTVWKLHEKKKTKLNGKTAVRTVITQRIGPMTTKVLKYFLMAGEHVYVLSFAAPPDHFAADLPVFERIAASFRTGAKP